MPKITDKYREQIRREARQEAIAEERKKIRVTVRNLIDRATADHAGAEVAHWLIKVLPYVDG